MSLQLISRSPDLKKLRDEGYDIAVQAGFLLVKDVPYVNARREVRRGVLVSSLCLAGDVTTTPDTHVVHFAGEYPCRSDGTAIEKIRNASERKSLAEGVVVDHTFSAKPTAPHADYYAKMTTYVAILEGHARQLEPGVTAKTFPVVASETADTGDDVFRYIDTASSRAEIDRITWKLAIQKVAIVGLGGTGSYVLDLVAKTPVKELHLFDGDAFLQHNAFRSPGAPSLEELREKPSKAVYFERIYSRMRRGIVIHPEYIDSGNVDALGGMQFVFLCLDPGPAKKLIVAKLEEGGVPFVDVGMGVYVVGDMLAGVLRVTTSTREQREHFRKCAPLGEGEAVNDYATNIQIADLNALNAALAVIKWKKLWGFYLDLEHDIHCTYTINGNVIANETAGHG